MIYEESHPPTRYQLSFQLHFNPPFPVLGRRVRRFCKRWRRRRRATSSAAWRRSCEVGWKRWLNRWNFKWETMGKTIGKTIGNHGIEVRCQPRKRWKRWSDGRFLFRQGWDDSNEVLLKWDPFPRINRDPFRFCRAKPGPNNEVDRNGWVRSKPTTFCWCFASFIW